MLSVHEVVWLAREEKDRSQLVQIGRIENYKREMNDRKDLCNPFLGH